MVDTNDDGKVSRDEADAAAKEMEDEDDVQLKALVTDPSKEQWEDLKEACEKATEGDNTIEKPELIKIVGDWAKKHELKLPEGWKKYIGHVFDYVDADHNGHVTRKELEAAMKEDEDKDDEDKKRR